MTSNSPLFWHRFGLRTMATIERAFSAYVLPTLGERGVQRKRSMTWLGSIEAVPTRAAAPADCGGAERPQSIPPVGPGAHHHDSDVNIRGSLEAGAAATSSRTPRTHRRNPSYRSG